VHFETEKNLEQNNGTC